MNLQFSYDPSQDIITIEGIQYSGDLFREWGANAGLPVGTVHGIEARYGGAFALRKFHGVTFEDVETLQGQKARG